MNHYKADEWFVLDGFKSMSEEEDAVVEGASLALFFALYTASVLLGRWDLAVPLSLTAIACGGAYNIQCNIIELRKELAQ